MDEKASRINQNDYDTSINIIGGLKDVGVIYKAIGAYFNDGDSLEDLILERNELNLRTERSRVRVKNAIKVGFLSFKNQDHIDLVESTFQEKNLIPERELILFWQYALSNRLFRDISNNVFIRVYLSGRTNISKEDIIAYLKEFVSQNKNLNLDWSENTIHTLSTKYLNLLTKFNFLEGARIKSFRHTRPSDESLVLFLYFARLYAPENRNIYRNEMLPLSFVTSEDLLNRLKKLSIKGFFNMSFNGVDLNIELTQSYKGICDVLYNRS
jgi:hypothetical protein